MAVKKNGLWGKWKISFDQNLALKRLKKHAGFLCVFLVQVFEVWPQGHVCTKEHPELLAFPRCADVSTTAQLFRGALLTISNSRAMADVPQITFMESSYIPLCDLL